MLFLVGCCLEFRQYNVSPLLGISVWCLEVIWLFLHELGHDWIHWIQAVVVLAVLFTHVVGDPPGFWLLSEGVESCSTRSHTNIFGVDSSFGVSTFMVYYSLGSGVCLTFKSA